MDRHQAAKHGPYFQRQKTNVSPNAVASRIVATSRAPSDKMHTEERRRERWELRTLWNEAMNTEYEHPFSYEAIESALKDTTPGKVPGFDNIHPEFLMNCGKYAKLWLAKLFTDIMPREFKKSKVIAILKPGKPADSPQSYKPVALLYVTYKLLERLINNRIGQRIYDVIPIEQACFRAKRSCVDHVAYNLYRGGILKEA